MLSLNEVVLAGIILTILGIGEKTVTIVVGVLLIILGAVGVIK